MSEQFTDRAREVIRLASEHARRLEHEQVGTSHLLIGLCDLDGTISRSVLKSLGVTLRPVEDAVKAALPAGRPRFLPQEKFTPQYEQALELARAESLATNRAETGTAHLLLALTSTGGMPVQILRKMGVDLRDLRVVTLKALGVDPAATPHPEPPERADSASEKVEAAQQGPQEGAETVPTHHDRPATRDELGRARLAAVLGERIRRVRGEDTETLPKTRRQRRRKLATDNAAARRTGSFMVHVYAPWGAGKSSLLNFLARDLRNRSEKPRGAPLDVRLSQWIVVDFSAWQHQRLVAPWWWLLAAVQRSCARELWRICRRRWLWFWIRDLSWRLWNARAALITVAVLIAVVTVAWRVGWFGLSDEPLTVVSTAILTATAAIALAGTIAGLARGVGKWLAIGSVDGAVRFLKRAHDPLGVYKRRFRWLVKAAGRPIVVFIDDLDRCRPTYVVELLEGIQTLFADEPVTYVVAADRDWLCDSFSHAYEQFVDSVNEPGRPLGFLFMEKTFQISLEIPPMPRDDRRRYWSGLTRLSVDGADATKRDRGDNLSDHLAGAASQEEVEEGVETLLQQGHGEDEVLQAAVRRLNAPEVERETDMLLDEFGLLVENNPRSMKRLMNAYGLERDRLLREGHMLTKHARRQLVLLTILRLRWPLLADHLRASPEDVRFCDGTHPVPDAHPFADLLSDPGVRQLFDGSHVDVRLAVAQIEQFPTA